MNSTEITVVRTIPAASASGRLDLGFVEARRALSRVPVLVLMKPDRVGVGGDEFLDADALDQWFTRDSFLLAVDKDRLIVPFSLAPHSPGGGGSRFSAKSLFASPLRLAFSF